MSRFNPESSNDTYMVGWSLTGKPGDPYNFNIDFYVDGNDFHIEGLSMGDMVNLNRDYAAAIREARHAKQQADKEQA